MLTAHVTKTGEKFECTVSPVKTPEEVEAAMALAEYLSDLIGKAIMTEEIFPAQGNG